MGDEFIDWNDLEQAYQQYENELFEQAMLGYMRDFPVETQDIRTVFLN